MTNVAPPTMIHSRPPANFRPLTRRSPVLLAAPSFPYGGIGGHFSGMTETVPRQNRVDPRYSPSPIVGCTQALDVSGVSRLLFISGQGPEALDGTVPTEFNDQCRLSWAHVLTTLRTAHLETRHLVKVTTILADRKYAESSLTIYRDVLGAHRPALTVVIAGSYDARWLIEIEAIAVA